MRGRSPRSSPASSPLAVGVAGIALSLGFGLGSLTQPGPGLWPFVVSVAVTALSLAQLAFGRDARTPRRSPGRASLTALGVLTLVGLAALLPVIGFEMPVAAASWSIWLRFLGGESWRTSAVISVVTVAAFYALFVLALSDPPPAPDLKGGLVMDFSPDARRLRHRPAADQPALLPRRRRHRHAHRRAARPRPGGDHRDPAADHLRHRAGLGDHHAGRHLLRRAVRRHHHLGAAPPARRGVARSSPSSTGSRWPSRARAGTALGIAAIGSFIGGTVSIIGLSVLAPVVAGYALDFGPPEYAALGAARRPAGLDGQQRRQAQGRHRRRDRPAARDRRPGRLHRRRALHVRQPQPGRRHRLRADRHGPLRPRRDPLQPRGERHKKVHAPAKVTKVWPSRAGPAESKGAIGRGSGSASAWASCPVAAPCSSSLVAYAVEKRRAKQPERFGRGRHRGRGRPRRPRTTRPRRRRSSRC